MNQYAIAVVSDPVFYISAKVSDQGHIKVFKSSHLQALPNKVKIFLKNINKIVLYSSR